MYAVLVELAERIQMLMYQNQCTTKTAGQWRHLNSDIMLLAHSAAFSQQQQLGLTSVQRQQD